LGTPSRAGDAPTNSRTEYASPSASTSASRVAEVSNPTTFSTSTRFGLQLSRILGNISRMCRNERARGSSPCFSFPRRVYGWHGGDAVHTSAAPKSSSICSRVMCSMFRRSGAESGKFAEYTAFATSELSIAATPMTSRWVPTAFWSAQRIIPDPL